MNTEPASQANERRLALAGLLGVTLLFLAFAAEYLVRVTNNLWGDIAFSGWSAAVGHELTRGLRIYQDFVLPLPPGPFVLLSWFERASSGAGPSLLHESAVCTGCHVAMGILAYLIARPLVGRVNALLTSAGTLGWICGWAKELAYDHLAQVSAWTALALLTWAFRASDASREKKLSFLAGVAAGLGFLFKQSTASGVVLAGFVGIGYLAFVDRREQPQVARRARGAAAYAAGVLSGFAATVLCVALSGGSVAGFFRSVFVDGPRLKGGTAHLAKKTIEGAISEPIFVFSLAGVVLVAALAARIAARRGALVLHGGLPVGGDGASLEGAPLRWSHVLATWGVVAATFGVGATMLAVGAKSVPPSFTGFALLGFVVTQVGACLAAGYFFFSKDRRMQAYRASLLVALGVASVVSMSLTGFRPLDENNATIVLALATVFAGLEAADLGRLRFLALAFVLSTPLGSKLPRALMADGPTMKDGFFRGMRLNPAGAEVARAADRARALAGPSGTVLVLPEDPSLAALIGRERPPLCAGIVFADQYPDRCLERDLAYLGAHLPRVVVARPAPAAEWLPAFSQWRSDAPATALVLQFFAQNLVKYRRDSTFRTRWGDHETPLDVWVLRGAGE